ncbi:putative F-box protein At5g55150 [Macadamia integrifolia]|uniref:putative F-box protein At5g55150 n=1 Tax=Macadamia integrifolia TaxID=60698 RepID=UPI001C52BF28|nr:putative F-box protein At5g55150 [Macadamia integrifolia]
MASAVDWSQLLPELLELILDRLTCLSDHLHFVSVCSSWRSVIISNCCPRRLLPFLMLPPSNDNTDQTRPFFNLSSHWIKELHVPEIHQKWCCGSSHGWLVTVDESTGEIQLFNPVSRGRIQLPSLSTFSYPQHNFEPDFTSNKHYIHKAILSSNPYRTSDYVVVANVTNRKMLAYWKPGADRWTTIRSEQWVHFEDFIYYKGLLYAISNNGPLVTYDFSFEPPIGKEIIGEPPGGRRCSMYYLVESLGELWLVSRQFKWLSNEVDNNDDANYYKDFIVHPPFEFKTMKFQVCKLDESKREWIQMKSIDDRILFLGNSYSISLPAQEFQGCKGNSIYFSDDYTYGPYEPPSEGYHDMGVFNFESRRVESFIELSTPSLTAPTFWFTPEPFGSATISFIFKLFNID